MAEPRKLPSGRFQIQFMLAGERHSKTFRTKREAAAYQREALVNAGKSKFIPPSHDRVTVGQRLDEWLTIREGDPDFKPSSHRVYKSRAQHIRAGLGDVKMGDLTVSKVKAWRNDLTESKGASTCGEALKVLRAFLTDMIEEGVVHTNVASAVSSPSHKTPEMTFLEPRELDRVVGCLDEQWAKDVVLGLAFLGCRANDLGDLTRDRVDRVGERIFITDRKTGNDRWLPIFDAVSEVVDRRLATGEWFLFKKPEWERLHLPTFRSRFWNPAVEAAGLGRRVRIHDLRHTAASWLIKQGFTPTQVAAYLGHSSPRQTMETYAHVFADDLTTMGEALNQLWRQRHDDRTVTPLRKAE